MSAAPAVIGATVSHGRRGVPDAAASFPSSGLTGVAEPGRLVGVTPGYPVTAIVACGLAYRPIFWP
jgi:hypothetical protein